jgi:hypothetical protein
VVHTQNHNCPQVMSLKQVITDGVCCQREKAHKHMLSGELKKGGVFSQGWHSKKQAILRIVMSYVNADPINRNVHITSDRWRLVILGWHKMW